MQAWRGRARALVRLAEAYQRVNDTLRERLTLNDAVKADPSLTQDPMFALWYQRLGTLEAQKQLTWEQKQKLQNALRANPRTDKSFGFGFDLISARGLFAVGGSLVIKKILFANLGLDVGDAGMDAGVVVAPLNGRWSPFIGIGGHVSFQKLGIDIGGGEGTVGDGMTDYQTSDVFGLHGRAELGAQFVGRSGFRTDLGFAIIAFKSRQDGQRHLTGFPDFSLRLGLVSLGSRISVARRLT
jgi:hypothetical protein